MKRARRRFHFGGRRLKIALFSAMVILGFGSAAFHAVHRCHRGHRVEIEQALAARCVEVAYAIRDGEPVRPLPRYGRHHGGADRVMDTATLRCTEAASRHSHPARGTLRR